VPAGGPARWFVVRCIHIHVAFRKHPAIVLLAKEVAAHRHENIGCLGAIGVDKKQPVVKMRKPT
jgi:hypothetical protein